MRVLVDECAPRALQKYLERHGYECRTVQDVGWSGKQNGELLTLAEKDFDVFLTIDSNLTYQQNLANRKISIVVIQSFSNRLEHLTVHFPSLLAALEKIKPGDIVKVGRAL